MVVILCKFCGDGVEVKAWREHLTGEKHRKNLPSKIVVEGKFESSKIDEVHEYFAKFGNITKKDVISRNREFITLIEYFFEDPTSYSTIAHKQHSFNGQQLEISWCCKMDDYKTEDTSASEESHLNFDSDAHDSAYTPGDKSEQTNLEGNVKTKKKRRLFKPKSSLRNRSVCKSISLSPNRRCERFKTQSRSRSRSCERNKDNFKTKKSKWNQRSTCSDSGHSPSPKRERSETHSKEQSRSRSRSRSYGRNKDKENTRAKNPKRNQKEENSDTEHSRSPNRKRRRSSTSSEEQSRSRSRSCGRNKNKGRKKPKRDQRRSTSSDSQYSVSSCRSRKRSKKFFSRSKESRKELLEQRKTFLVEVREKLKEISKPVIPIYQVPSKSPILVAPSQVFHTVAPPFPLIQSTNLVTVVRSPQEVKSPDCEKSDGTGGQQDLSTVDEVSKEMNTSCSKDAITTTRGEGEDSFQERKDKIMLQCLKSVKVMTIHTSKRLRVLSPQKANSKPAGHLSPLRNSQTKLRFTSWSQEINVGKFEEILLDILHSLDICNEPNDISKLIEAVVEVLRSGVAVDKKTGARILQISLLGAMKDCKSKDFVDVGTQSCGNIGSIDKQVGTEVLNWVLRDPGTYASSAFLLGRGSRKIEESNGFVDGRNTMLGPLQLKPGYEEKILY